MLLNSKVRALPPLLATMAAVSLLAACGGSNSDTSPSTPGSAPGSIAMPAICTKAGPVVFAVSGRQDSPAPGLTTSMESALQQAAAQNSAVGVVNVDGTPTLIAAASANTQGMNSEAAQARAAEFADAVAEKVQSVRATSPHADVLDALNMAGDAIRAACSYGGTIFLEDSGLEDVKPLDFTAPGQLEALPAKVVSFLSSEGEIPELAGITVVLVGVGDTAPPQQRLAGGQQSHLRAIWSAIIKAGGGRVETDRSPRGNLAVRSVPTVSLITVPPLATWPGRDGMSVTLPDTGPVGFQPNNANFRDPSAARAALGDIALYLLDTPAARIELTGTTARWGGDAWDMTLSARRANTVMSALITLGVSPGQMTARGVGWRSPCYEPDGGPDGRILDAQAMHNRSVIVTVLPSPVTC
jgi:OmpA-OmpF porin, OOP family